MFFVEDYPATEAPLRTDPQFLRALAVAPDRDDDAVELIRQHLALSDELLELGSQIDGLISKRAGDESFRRRCLNALEARAELTALQQRELLRDWWPTLRHVCLDN
ncbi:hypothetical protein I6F36_05755 [Bradyrhizobium sp. BRP19]|uniref:hypothetical protein n=1 Tax=Bradyrhizobium sp. BRP19 TaxID=2793823 RepID=UPI001CD5A2A7|nr:hypothetical protein [Bradyrhizobium sp. BRP19]MCA1546308.1 hypothetical protein [Bradyrhizobium sp. BRP19]